MKLSRLFLAASLAAAGFLGIVSSSRAEGVVRKNVARVATKAAATPKATTATGTFSVEVPYVRSYAPADGGQSGTLVLTPSAGHTFNVSLVATNPAAGNATGPGVALPQTDILGYFTFPSLTGNASIPEVFVKIVLGTNAHYWVFWGHLTSLPYVLTVRDNVTQISTTYSVPAGSGTGPAPGGYDTGTFAAGSVTTPVNKTASFVAPDAFVRTSVDISNNTTTDGVNAFVQYCYSSGGTFAGCTAAVQIGLGHYDNFHTGDIVAYLVSQGALPASAEQDSSGTLLVTFENLPSQLGWEGSVTARTYNRVSEVDILRGTVGCGQNVSLFFDSATAEIVGTATDTVPAPDPEEGSLSTILGIHNTDANGTGNPVSVTVNLYDSLSGQAVGNPIALTNIQPGELRLVPDLFSAAAVPSNVTSVIVFGNAASAGSSVTIEGFLLTQDTFSGDTRFDSMKCSAGCY